MLPQDPNDVLDPLRVTPRDQVQQHPAHGLLLLLVPPQPQPVARARPHHTGGRLRLVEIVRVAQERVGFFVLELAVHAEEQPLEAVRVQRPR
eukprot:1607488-Rhodomonas_salina.1